MARHDPHCTCPDCLAEFEAQQTAAILEDMGRLLAQPAPPVAELPFALTPPPAKPDKGRQGGLF